MSAKYTCQNIVVKSKLIYGSIIQYIYIYIYSLVAALATLQF